MRAIFWRLYSRWLHVRDALGLSPAVRWISGACVAVFLIQLVSSHVRLGAGLSFGSMMQLHFGLCPPLLLSGFVWQLVTYMFLHGSWWHLLLNMLTLLMFGSAVEMEIGTARFLRIFLLGGVIGGLAWAGFDWGAVTLAMGGDGVPSWLYRLAVQAVSHRGTLSNGFAICVGASGGLFSLIGAYAAIFPRRRLILFVGWPVVLQARTMALLLGLTTILFAIYGLGNIAYMTHLFGGLAGYALGLRLAKQQSWGEEA